MATDAARRNAQARQIVERWIAAAKASDRRMDPAFRKEYEILRSLIPINAAGFRGVVLTGMVGKVIDPNYDFRNDFYGCSPRSIFEKGIYYALVENGVPCGKSDPLNVAKNANVIDKNWASGRRPESAALAAVEYMRILYESWSDQNRREGLIRIFVEQLWEYALLCQSKNKPLAEFEGEVSITLGQRLAAFVLQCPEGGAVPQFVLGTLLNLLRVDDPNIRAVEGVSESVFGTNTTSKKPADVWEVQADGDIGRLYEITAKTVDQKRLDDCVDSLSALGLEGKYVTFICRIPADIENIPVKKRTLTHRGVAFQFLDLASFLVNGYCILKDEQQHAMIQLVDDFVKDTNRKIKTKEAWATYFG